MNGSELLLLVLCAFAGHRYSVRNQMVRGTTPWHWPSIVWALICLTGPIGLLLEFVAVRMTKPITAPIPAGSGGTPQPWSPVTTNDIEVAPLVNHKPGVSPADDGSGKMALFGWYPDPSGRHERRYWDGKGWTGLAEDARVTVEDPL
jgi:hypothetical protein